MLRKRSLLSLVRNVADEASMTSFIVRGARQIVTLAPWQLWLARQSPDFAASIRGADAVTIDGRWLNACLKLAGRNYPLVTGRSVVQWHFNGGREQRIAVLGSSQEALEKLQAAKPDWLCIGGKFGAVIDEGQLANILASIQRHSSSLVFIALGSPKQELWGRRIADLAEVSVIGVGGSIETVVGLRKPPTGKFQSLGLEWLQRTLQDPKRFVPRIAQALSVMPSLLVEAIAMRIRLNNDAIK
jgi:N-acetylglucosaminyldiphosphoundecaprenol N-acetyl-beta-D-mannosaminyltransferase